MGALTTQIVEDGTGGCLRLGAAELLVVEGPDAGLKVALGARSLRLGTAPTCEVVLHDPTVSAQHARVDVSVGGHAIRDTGSTNGVRIGGLRVEGAPLHGGMRIALGSTTIEVRDLGRDEEHRLAEPGQWGELIAYSPKMRLLVAALRKLAATDITMLVEGESGTGKEIVAETIHAMSERAQGPFVVVDCGAIPRDLFGAEILGYEQGAFTGARSSHAGLLESAAGGTVFLDEVAEIPLDVQPFLLGAIERRRIRRIGAQRDVALDVRLVAATHRNLAEAVRRKEFRHDLFHRMAVGRVTVPPLRERAEDLAPLVRCFAEREGVVVPPEMMRLLAAYDWPGNVRELRNAVARAQIARHPAELLGPGEPGPVDAQELQELPFKDARQRAMDRFERLYLAAAIAAAGGNLSGAARHSGLSRSFFMKLASRHRLRLKDGS